MIREQLELASAVAATKGDYSEHLNMNSVDKLIRVDEEFFSKSKSEIFGRQFEYINFKKCSGLTSGDPPVLPFYGELVVKSVD